LRSGIAGSVDQALKMVGLNEKKDQDVLKEFMRTGGRNLTSDQNAWCARYVNAINVNAGLPSLESVVGAEGAWSSRAFEKWGNKIDVAKGDAIQPGDVFVKPRGNDPNKGHVGVATGNYRVNDKGVTEYEMLSGNIGGEKTIPGTNLPAQGGGVGLTWETIGGGGGGESAPGAGRGGVIAVRRGERPTEVADTGPEEGGGKGFRLDQPGGAMVAQQFTGGGFDASLPGGPVEFPTPSVNPVAGAGSPRTRGETLDQPDGGVLDRATSSQIEVNQNGKLSVDVSAPAGTSVSAEGSGVFNQTETNRSVPMERAQAG
jgi:hypothetical protein